MTNLDHALQYASLGWRVFPLHAMKKGLVGSYCDCEDTGCTTKAKHPRIKAWQHNATTKKDQIIRWWTQWPESNIGVATGEGSGIIVIDIDDVSVIEPGGNEPPPTCEQQTGSGGRHLIYQHPGYKVKTCTGVFPGVDSRADGGYIVVAPSNHASGDIYRWTISPFHLAPTPAPSWWLEEVNKEPVKTAGPSNGERIFTGNRNDHLTAFGGSLRRMGLGYPGIFSSLMEINKSQCEPPLEELEVSKIARSVSGYAIETDEEKNQREHGETVAKLWQENKHQEIAKSLASYQVNEAGPPPDFMPGRGLIRDIAQYIISQSERPLPLLAVGAAVAFVGVLAGAKYRYKSGLRSNLYIVGLADSGTGKNKAVTIIDKIASSCGPGVEAFIGGNDIASGAGLLTSVKAHRSRFFAIDEFGLWLQAITSKYAGGYKLEIMRLLMELYSRADGTYRGKEYGDQKIKPREDIKNPVIGVYGISTHHTFNEALTSGNAVDGSLSRMIIIPDAETRPDRVRPVYISPDQSLLDFVANIVKHKPEGSGNLSGKVAADIQEWPAQEVEILPEVEDAWIDLDDAMTHYMTGPSEKAIYSRVAENALKMAIAYAVSVNYEKPVIDHEAFLWARDIVLWCANKLLERVKTHIADNDIERIYQKIEQVVEYGKAKGVTKSELFRLAGRQVKPYEFDQYVNRLVDDKTIFFHRSEPDGKGRPSERYFHAKYYETILDTI